MDSIARRKAFFLMIGMLIAWSSCGSQNTQKNKPENIPTQASVECRTGADQTEKYFPYLQGKRFALVVNQTSCIALRNDTALLSDKTPNISNLSQPTPSISIVDSLCHAGLRPSFIFAPEHGFRGSQDAGANIQDDIDNVTGLKIYSLYGKNKKPSAEQMADLDVVIFDIQDVGCRFYTYLSTLHYVMEACAENQVELLILDRPNPNDYIDGPVRKADYQSFVGMHPIPVLHGCTLGELAQMIQGEGWLGDKKCSLRIITVEGWRHGQAYSLPIKPSPNLPNDHAIGLYPSLCLFEGTVISVGRGTTMPFEVIGYPSERFGDFCFTPKSLQGFDTHPMYENQICHGMDLRQDTCPKGFSLSYLMTMYQRSGMGSDFFKNPRFFDLLAGEDALRKQITAGWSETEIRQSWQKELEEYRKMREGYLLYP